jgi:hypothetical protein
MAFLHVSPDGDDAGDGSEQRPFRTLVATQRKLRELAAEGRRWARVEINANYPLTEPFVLSPEDSGESPQHPITYAGGGLSAGIYLRDFHQEGPQWVALVPASVLPPRDLWVNGKRAIRARSPNDGFYRVAHAGADNRTSFIANPRDFLRLTKPADAELVFFHDWSISRVPLAAVDAATHTYRFAGPVGANSPNFTITNFEPHPRYYLENGIELLDTPGEWCFDPASRELHYLPRKGESIERATVVVPGVEQLVVLRGEADKRVENIVFEGLAFSYAGFHPPGERYAEIQANWHEIPNGSEKPTRLPISASVVLDRARNIRFTNCRFEHSAAGGLKIEHCQSVTAEDCTFADLGGNGIMVGSPLKGDVDPATEHVTIENSLINGCGRTYFGAVGIWVGIAVDTIIRNNEIKDLPYTGVSVGWCWNDKPTICRGNHIENNHIHHVMQLLSDGGGIYTLGRQPGTTLRGNLIHDVAANAGRAESNGIFMDQGSNEILVEGNTIHNVARSPIRFNEAGKNTFIANRLASPAGVPAFAYRLTKAEDQTFQDNQEIADAGWRPAADDSAARSAGQQETD